MSFVIGVPYLIGKAAYKAYKKHQAEKDARDRGVHHDLVDPSHEISPEISYGHARNTSSYQQQTPIEFRLEHRRSSSTSIASDSSAAAHAEVELALEQDEEFRRFIQQQKQVYISQRRAIGQNNNSSFVATSSHAELPASQPPAYDDVIAADVSRAKTMVHAPQNPMPQRAQVPPEQEEEIYLVSPTSVYSESRVSEIDGSEISPTTPTRASPAVVAELPGSSRPAVELPVAPI